MDEITFEEALEKLEGIVSDLEDGGITLDMSLKKYEEGIKLSQVCTKALNSAEKKIEFLKKTANGDFETEPFGDVHAVSSKQAKSKKKSKSSSDNDSPTLF